MSKKLIMTIVVVIALLSFPSLGLACDQTPKLVTSDAVKKGESVIRAEIEESRKAAAAKEEEARKAREKKDKEENRPIRDIR